MAAPHIVVMGVSGSGKSSVGKSLADSLRIRFVDGDGLHPQSNIDKMAAGIPLTDEDRWPWLDRVAAEFGAHPEDGLVVACSALRTAYRDRIRSGAPDVYFVELFGSRETLEQRLGQRSGHFMPASLLDSQLATLESLTSDERGLIVDIDAPITSIARSVVAHLTGVAP